MPRHADGLDQVPRPVERVQVEGELATGDAVVGHHLARQPVGQEVGDGEPVGGAGEGVGVGAPEPHLLQQARNRIDPHAEAERQPVGIEHLAQADLLRLGPLVVPADGARGRAAFRIEPDAGLADAGGGHADDAAGVVHLRHRRPDGGNGAFPQPVRVEFDPARMGHVHRRGRRAFRDLGPGSGEDQRADAGGAGIDTEQQRLSLHCRPSSPSALVCKTPFVTLAVQQ
jgi:hypothetical protein